MGLSLWVMCFDFSFYLFFSFSSFFFFSFFSFFFCSFVIFISIVDLPELWLGFMGAQYAISGSDQFQQISR